MKFNKNTVTTVIVSSSIVLASFFSSIFIDSQGTNAKIMALTKKTLFYGVELKNSTIKITEVNIRPRIECQENGDCKEKFDISLLVNRYTDETFESDIDQDVVNLELPDEDLNLNLDLLYQKLISIDDERYNNSDAIMIDLVEDENIEYPEGFEVTGSATFEGAGYKTIEITIKKALLLEEGFVVDNMEISQAGANDLISSSAISEFGLDWSIQDNGEDLKISKTIEFLGNDGSFDMSINLPQKESIVTITTGSMDLPPM